MFIETQRSKSQQCGIILAGKPGLMKMFLQTVKTDNQAVKIQSTAYGFRATHLINTRRGIDSSDAQVVNARTFKTTIGAVRWANKVLEETA